MVPFQVTRSFSGGVYNHLFHVIKQPHFEAGGWEMFRISLHKPYLVNTHLATCAMERTSLSFALLCAVAEFLHDSGGDIPSVTWVRHPLEGSGIASNWDEMMNFSSVFVRSEFPIVKLFQKDLNSLFCMAKTFSRFSLYCFCFLFSSKTVFSLRIEASNKLKPWKEWWWRFESLIFVRDIFSHIKQAVSPQWLGQPSSAFSDKSTEDVWGQGQSMWILGRHRRMSGEGIRAVTPRDTWKRPPKKVKSSRNSSPNCIKWPYFSGIWYLDMA